MNTSPRHESILARALRLPRRVVGFYVEGFRSMTVGRSLWVLILIKLFIIFFVFKLFFFPDLLERDYDTDAERAAAVRHSLTTPRPSPAEQ